jgi:rhodanese-related sulfurtransferase
MKRRALLASGATVLGTLAGCLSDDPVGGGDTATSHAATTARPSTATAADEDGPREIGGEETGTEADRPSPREATSNPGDPTPADGFAPEQDDVPAARDIDTSTYERIDVNGESVALAPIEDVYYWWARGEARFADARGISQYTEAHVLGAVSSPVQTGIDETPVGDWGTDERIVCYCGCPHHLSSIRAATLQSNDYGEVYVIDEGFFEWANRDHPVVGDGVSDRRLYTIRGRTARRYAGEMAWARHVGSDRVEAAPVAHDGTYELHVRFADLTPRSELRVRAPDYAVTATLRELTDGVVTSRQADE